MELKFDIRVEEGMLVAVCEEPDMATHGRTMEELIKMVRELISCHFDDDNPRREAKVEIEEGESGLYAKGLQFVARG